MRFHCNRCNKDFTTLSNDKGKKFAFRHFMLEKMFCSHCGASNIQHIPKKPLRKTRGRYQPVRRSVDPYENGYTPAIVLHSLCQKRLVGNPMSIEGMEIVCEGCPDAFNCFTGNVDDGSLNTSEYSQDRKDTKIKEQKEIVVEAKVKTAEKKRNDELDFLEQLRDQMGKVGFSYRFHNGLTYAHFGGTIWKLGDEDEKAILEQTWHTSKTKVIKNTLNNREIKLTVARNLLYYENYFKLKA